ncbi:hypothetical protein [Flavivirga spongiicola]|uniref:GLPGLI family protein n=1 Tax=Flavivirga spongiicola TaxID=421621 RepID=A0ABU7XR72_9FLAO|nr:hypothetical protein [Flavivirga sp. MEBiC05379]MDO5977327.1 hypothetical protein [Flavivirga sp. MEBiC05379]
MRYRAILIFFLCNSFMQGFSQKTDTLYWHNALNKYDINEIREIKFTINDSTYKKVGYWKGKIISIKYTGRVNKCLISIKQDTLYTQNGAEIHSIIKNEAFQLGQKSNCDSLLLIKKIKKYRKGQLIQESILKRVGEFSDCPCGEWKFYKNTKLVGSKEFSSCYDSKQDNITLMKTVWNPDKQFKLELYEEQMPFAMPGGGSDNMATIILKDKNGKMLNYISSNSTESTMYRNIEIKWDMDEKIVWYGKARLFELKKKTPLNNDNKL